MCWQWKQRGLHGLADMFEATKWQTFANWRWGTLDNCCVSLSRVLSSLRIHFDPQLFARSREQTGLNLVVSALSSDLWHCHFEFVHWLCRWLTSLMNWGTGCRCHPPGGETDQLARDQCPMKGRRFAEAYAHGMAWLRSGLDHAHAYTE